MKYEFSLALLVLSLAGNAQIRKQSTLLGGQISYNNYHSTAGNTKYKNQGGTFAVSAGTAYRENKVIGANLSFSTSRQFNKVSGTDSSEFISNRYDFALFFRSYKKLAKDFYFFSQFDGAFISSRQTRRLIQTQGNFKSVQRGGVISFTPGISYQLYRKMQIELTIPNIFFMQYLATKPAGQRVGSNEFRDRQFIFSSNISQAPALGYLGIGFRFVL